MLFRDCCTPSSTRKTDSFAHPFLRIAVHRLPDILKKVQFHAESYPCNVRSVFLVK